MTTAQKLSLETRQLTSTTLLEFDLTGIDASQLVLGTSGFEGDQMTFELYIPGERPEDARVISSAVMDMFSGTGNVEVFLPRRGPR